MFKDKERHNQYHRDYQKKGRQEDPEKYRARQRAYTSKLKRKVYDLYGNKCNNCGSTVESILEVNHLNGGGCQERKSNPTSAGLYRKVLKEPSRFNLLCRVCNALHYVTDILGISGYTINWEENQTRE